MTIKWSYSGLKDFLNCPRQYHETKVLKNFVKQDTRHTLYGKEVHAALEAYARSKTPLPKNYEQFQPVVDVLLEIPGDKYIEYKMALTESLRPCGFEDPDYWVRGIADLMIIDNDVAMVLDYKTGSNKYPDPKQLKLMALMIFQHFPEVVRVKGGLIFLSKNSFMPEEYVRGNIGKYWADFLPDLNRLQYAAKTGHWHPQPSGLCGYCVVKTCQFYKEQ